MSIPLKDDVMKDIKSLNDIGTQVKNVISDVKNNQTNIGINANIRIKLGETPLHYCFNVGWNRFTVDKVSLNVEGFTQELNLNLVRNVFPLAAGLQFDIIPLDVVRVYITGDLTCSIIKNSVDNYVFKIPSTSIPVSWPVIFGDQTIRFGGGFGTGAEFRLGVMTLDLSAKFNVVNFIKDESTEPTQSYIMTNLSVFFGK
jgi:hypothetical protein